MSWASIANNQLVSWNNLLDAVNNGVFEMAQNSVPPGSSIITRAHAEDYVVINPITSKATNQLVKKSDLVPSTGAFKFKISANGTTSTEACSLILEDTSIAWCNTSTPTAGTTFYADYRFQTIFPMSGYSGLFLHFKLYTSTGNGYRARFNLATSTINNTPVACL